MVVEDRYGWTRSRNLERVHTEANQSSFVPRWAVDLKGQRLAMERGIMNSFVATINPNGDPKFGLEYSLSLSLQIPKKKKKKKKKTKKMWNRLIFH